MSTHFYLPQVYDKVLHVTLGSLRQYGIAVRLRVAVIMKPRHHWHARGGKLTFIMHMRLAWGLCCDREGQGGCQFLRALTPYIRVWGVCAKIAKVPKNIVNAVPVELLPSPIRFFHVEFYNQSHVQLIPHDLTVPSRGRSYQDYFVVKTIPPTVHKNVYSYGPAAGQVPRTFFFSGGLLQMHVERQICIINEE